MLINKKMGRAASLAILLSASLAFYLFNTDHRINKWLMDKLSFTPYNSILETTAINLFNDLNVFKVFHSKSVDDVIDLDLSYEDIKSFDRSFRCSSSIFIEDRCKFWRKGLFTHQDYEDRVKVKLSGTSKTPYYRSFTFWQGVRRKLDENLVYNPVSAGYSFTIKADPEKLFQTMRRFSLLSPYDDWSFFQQVLNKLARDYGLITTYGRPFILRINDVEAGVYMLQEKIAKNLLERDYGITNYSILKSNDDWDKIPFGHMSNTDYDSEDKEQEGVSDQAIGRAQNQLRRLFMAIEQGDIEEVGRLVDIEYIATLSAFESIYGSKHSSYGDNRRYIYNFSDGRFYPTFRMEGNPALLEVDQNIIPRIVGDDGVDQLVDLLAKNNKFVTLKTQILIKLVASQDKFFMAYDEYLTDYQHVLDSSARPTQKIRMKNDLGMSIYKANIEIIKKYLSYNKIFVSKISDDTSCHYSILVDSFAPITVNGTALNRGRNRVDGLNCVGELVFENEAAKSTIEAKDIFINYEYETSNPSRFEDVFSFVDDGETVFIKSGKYSIQNHTEFPRDRNVVIEAGTEIMIAANRSVLFHNGLVARGSNMKPIVFKSVDEPFGSILVKANNQRVQLSNLIVSGGGEGIIDNTQTTGQFVIVHGDVLIENSVFTSSASDDGLNIKYSKVDLKNNIFEKNFGDQVDLDYCTGSVTDNLFIASVDSAKQSETDGLDVSGSSVRIYGNRFSGFTDKAISVGEKSSVTIIENSVSGSSTGVAVKDGSRACLEGNEFLDNTERVVAYIKKFMYDEPSVFSTRQDLNQNSHDINQLESCNEFN